ncbi:cytochrome P450 [Aspergillus ibericus CBS 121593]|uniref:Cytochrome P450 alkane hydroxylase n=1 Tax=Aspergillus ibericus CBS 121593 TaxID=1448316 RepID=A0A395H1U4_9EURO|nr:cytochrome P450 alkane hydroxylase [Aspergillus ibericus CBS 121593]RAL01349.1 cytochrome P450 alkane hydroxylase [Aspergillus ibericus CBS 121593]
MLEILVAQVTPVKASVCLAGIFFLACLLRKVQVSREISRLGARAPRIRFRLPYAIDHIYHSIVANNNFQDVPFWQGSIVNAKGASSIDHPQTAELDAGISNRTIVTTDPENIRAVLTGQFADFGKGEDFHRDWKEFLGDSIFVTDGELWSRSRQLIRPMFTRDRIVDTELFEKHIQHLLPLLAGTKDKKAVDVTPLFLRYTLDAATDYLLGEGTNSLQNPATAFAEAFKYVQHRQGAIFRYGSFNFLLSRTQFRHNLQIMNDFIQPYIDRVLSLPTSDLPKEPSKSKPSTFLHALAHFTRDPQILRDQLTAILLAGRDTTATTLSFCLYELARHPTVVSHLRTEIATHLGLGPHARKPTYPNLKDMKYLTAILHETTRLYPVVPFNVRYALAPTTLPTGGGPTGTSPIGIRPHTRIIYSTMLMQRDPAFYPPPGSENYFDPGKWIPERWLSGWSPAPWHFVPFNGGPRICLGQQFALVEMGYTLVRILQVYGGVRALPGRGMEDVHGEVRLRFEITLNPGCELNCVFERDADGDGDGDEKERG